jgi:hypothetical protein
MRVIIGSILRDIKKSKNKVKSNTLLNVNKKLIYK